MRDVGFEGRLSPLLLLERSLTLRAHPTSVSIIEHHAARDAPSGTALWLGETIAAARGTTLEKAGVLSREGEIGARPAGAIGIQTLRGGDNPGEHTIHFIGQGERIELAHRSFTRDHFASGSVRAARWLLGREPGLYTMADVLGLAG